MKVFAPKIQWPAVALAATLTVAAATTCAKEPIVGSDEIDQVVVSKLSSLYGINSKVIAHVDLTRPFDTKSQWTLVIGKQPDEESTATDGLGEPVGAVSVCFVKDAVPNCSDAVFLEKCREQKVAVVPGERPFYELSASKLVYPGPGKTLLMIKASTRSGANGSHGIFTVLFDYDRKADGFRVGFFNVTGSNGNQETRFIETGPLLGAVLVADPYGGAPPPTRVNPYGYSVEVYKRDAAGRYARVLAYRGRTSYGDGNPLAVIDSEMPETLHRLGLWKPGDVLSVPLRMPAGCTRLVMRKGVEWCEPNNSVEPTPEKQRGSR